MKTPHVEALRDTARALATTAWRWWHGGGGSAVSAPPPPALDLDEEEMRERATYPPDAATRADALVALAEQARDTGAFPPIPTELLPDWLLEALDPARLQTPEIGWPEFAITEHPIDWPTLVDRYRGDIAWNYTDLEANAAPWPQVILAAHRMLGDRGATPILRMSVGIARTGQVLLTPLGLFYDGIIDAATKAEVSEVLRAGGGWVPESIEVATR
ncbi:hypothetical protein [Nocardia paucivorans]|uniref:hypothetical protein n=1 Tax=Nocardia paucivorans TaxID=114259 RepID=UPI0003092A65|nr:hypothetical protein [Nocardia paucivorans]